MRDIDTRAVPTISCIWEGSGIEWPLPSSSLSPLSGDYWPLYWNISATPRCAIQMLQCAEPTTQTPEAGHNAGSPQVQLALAILKIGEAISNARFGEDIARPGGRGFDLASQLADKHMQVLDILFVTGAPYLLE